MRSIYPGTNRDGYEIYLMRGNNKEVYYIASMNAQELVSLEKVNFDINPRGGLSIIRIGPIISANNVFMTQKNRIFSHLNDDDFIPIFAKDSNDTDFIYIPEYIDKIFTNKYLYKKDKYVLWDQVVVKIQRYDMDLAYSIPHSEFKKDGFVLYEVIG